MDFDIEDGATDGYAKQAILLYSGQAPGSYSSSGTTVMATLHDIKNVGTQARPRIEILPGPPITKEALLSVLSSLGDKHALSADFIPENLLSYSARHLLWWLPEQRRNVFFACDELGRRNGMVPHPPLVFLVMGGSYWVFAMKDSKRPNVDTELFHAPYFNVSDTGCICMGSAPRPSQLTPDSIKAMEDAFFNSSFTHINGQKKKVDHARGEYAFWKDMLDGVYPEFPMDILVPQKITIASVLKDIKTAGGKIG